MKIYLFVAMACGVYGSLLSVKNVLYIPQEHEIRVLISQQIAQNTIEWLVARASAAPGSPISYKRLVNGGNAGDNGINPMIQMEMERIISAFRQNELPAILETQVHNQQGTEL